LNNFAISSEGIGEALQRSAAALAQANNDLDKSIALVVAANDVVQNPETVGTALRTVALRIRGNTCYFILCPSREKSWSALRIINYAA